MVRKFRSPIQLRHILCLFLTATLTLPPSISKADQYPSPLPSASPRLGQGTDIQWKAVRAETEVTGDVLKAAPGNCGKDCGAYLLIPMTLGVFLTATLVLTTPLTVYQIASDPVGSEHEWEMGLHNSFVSTGSTQFSQFGDFSGVQLSTRIMKDWLGIGILGEAGYLNYTVIAPSGSARDQAFYALGGPEARYYFRGPDSVSIYLQALAGTASASDIGFMAVDRLGFSIPYRDRYRIHFPELGLHFIHLRGNESALTSIGDTFSYELGFGLSYQF
jgi:hypothetical protein